MSSSVIEDSAYICPKARNLSPYASAKATYKTNHNSPILNDPHNRFSPVGNILSTINVVGFVFHTLTHGKRGKMCELIISFLYLNSNDIYDG